MCGICGVIGPGLEDRAEGIVRRMMGAIVRRGPDEEGFLCAPPVAVGMRRLSIIDLQGGSQPVWNEDRTLAVVYNGELYNFRELREELERAGHRFQSRSDTEVIVHAYEAWGEGCVQRFHGMFAFAVVEIPKEAGGEATRVFLARDPLGIKPLYYSTAGGAFLFASEVRAILASRVVPPTLSAEALRSYLLFGSVCEPMTLVEGVFSLPPGHFMSISANRPSENPEPKSYWKAGPETREEATERPGSGAKPSPGVRVRALLESAVERHLIADVPVGVFLSSGLDSTAIAALASRQRDGIHTFTVAFPDLEFSEAGQARRTAEGLGTRHSELNLTGHEMLERLEEAIAAFDQPSMDGINTYFVSWAARQAGLKVALSGLGSDELFGGYALFKTVASVARLAALAHFFPRPIRSWAAAAVEGSKAFGATPDASRKALAAWIDPSSLPGDYFFTRTLFTPGRVAGAMGEKFGDWQGSAWWKWLSAAEGESRSMDSFTRISWLESRSYLVNTLLRDTDAMSMHHSLEVRVPFLDLPLVEYMLSLPQASKSGRGRSKALLIEALGDVLPEEIVEQRKRTFTFPWNNWLRGPLRARVAGGLADWSPALEPHLEKQFAADTWKDFLGGRTSWSRPWSLYVLNEWAKQHLSAGEADCSTVAGSAAGDLRSAFAPAGQALKAFNN
jgi:asparagine synthase (glutamine-hydrolysing)